MSTKSRIRIDLIGKTGAKVTKSTVVKAVQLLEQNPSVTLKIPSKEIVDFVYKSLTFKRSGDLILMSLYWNDTNAHNELKVEEAEFSIRYDRICLLPIEEALPKLIASLIVNVTILAETDKSNDFV